MDRAEDGEWTCKVDDVGRGELAGVAVAAEADVRDGGGGHARGEGELWLGGGEEWARVSLRRPGPSLHGYIPRPALLSLNTSMTLSDQTPQQHSDISSIKVSGFPGFDVGDRALCKQQVPQATEHFADARSYR